MKIEWQEKEYCLISDCGLYAIWPEMWPEYKPELAFASWFYNGKSRPLLKNVSYERAKEVCQNHKNWVLRKPYD